MVTGWRREMDNLQMCGRDYHTLMVVCCGIVKYLSLTHHSYWRLLSYSRHRARSWSLQKWFSSICTLSKSGGSPWRWQVFGPERERSRVHTRSGVPLGIDTKCSTTGLSKTYFATTRGVCYTLSTGFCKKELYKRTLLIPPKRKTADFLWSHNHDFITQTDLYKDSGCQEYSLRCWSGNQ